MEFLDTQVNTQSLLFQFLTTVFYWTGIIFFFVGLAILIAPTSVIRLGEVLNRWVSTDQAFHSLDTPKSVERFFYHHHRVFGVLLVLGAAYVLYTFAFAFDYSTLSAQVMLFRSRTVTDWLLNALSFLNISFSIVAILVGAIIFFRPSLLKGLEEWANKWYVTDESLKKLDVRLSAPDTLFRRWPRLLGFLIMAGSMYVVVSLRWFV